LAAGRPILHEQREIAAVQRLEPRVPADRCEPLGRGTAGHDEPERVALDIRGTGQTGRTGTVALGPGPDLVVFDQVACGEHRASSHGSRRKLPTDEARKMPRTQFAMILMRRYSTWPRSPSSPINPAGGTLNADSMTSPLHVTSATPPRTVTTISFQSCGR